MYYSVQKKNIFYIISLLFIFDSILIFILSGGYNVGTFLPGICGISIIVYLKVKEKFKFDSYKIEKNEKRIFKLTLFWFISLIIVLSFVFTEFNSNDNIKTDAMIILGGGIRGNIIPKTLQHRLDTAINYLSENKDTYVIVSGGKGIGESTTEAYAMKKYLIAKGINEKLILNEEKATSTYENLVFSKKIFREKVGKELKSINIVTSDFHMFRAKMLASRLKLDAKGISSKTEFYLYPNVLIREYLAVIKSFILERGD